MVDGGGIARARPIRLQCFGRRAGALGYPQRDSGLSAACSTNVLARLSGMRGPHKFAGGLRVPCRLTRLGRGARSPPKRDLAGHAPGFG